MAVASGRAARIRHHQARKLPGVAARQCSDAASVRGQAGSARDGSSSSGRDESLWLRAENAEHLTLPMKLGRERPGPLLGRRGLRTRWVSAYDRVYLLDLAHCPSGAVRTASVLPAV
jgi:hypothetical protein